MTRKGTTKAHGQKHEFDKFYTKSSVAAECLKLLDLSSYARIIEPSAGGGAFSDLLLADPSLPVLAFDLAPENTRVMMQDWFDYVTATPAATLVVGNPPFGQQCALAVRFFNHAFEVVGAQTVAFILPRSFRKASVQNRLFPKARLVYEVILGANSFELEGADYDLNAVFQVWERTKTHRMPVLLPTTSDHYMFVKKTEPHDFAIRRIGGRAGHAFFDTPEASEQSNYFIKLTERHNISSVIAMVNGLDFSVADNGTGPRSLSKRELVSLLDGGYRSTFPVKKREHIQPPAAFLPSATMACTRRAEQPAEPCPGAGPARWVPARRGPGEANGRRGRCPRHGRASGPAGVLCHRVGDRYRLARRQGPAGHGTGTGRAHRGWHASPTRSRGSPSRSPETSPTSGTRTSPSPSGRGGRRPPCSPITRPRA